MNYEDLLGWCDAYELSIEPIHTSALLRKYTHMLVVKRNGVRVDVGQVVYVSLNREIGIADCRGQLSWYRSGAVHRSFSGVVEAHIQPFGTWLYGLIDALRDYLQDSQSVVCRSAAS